MNGYQPGCNEIDQIVQHIGISNPVHRCVYGDAEEEDAGKMAETGCHSGYHFTTRESLNEQYEWHDGEDVVMGGKWC